MVGSKIKFYRKKRGFTLKELAEEICDESTLSRIEKNLQLPRLDTLSLLCSKLDIPIQYILNSQDNTDLIYMSRMKQLCREMVDIQDFEGLNFILEEIVGQKKVDLKVYNEFNSFIKWHEAIYTHKHLKNVTLAEEMLQDIIHDHSNIITETEIGIANSLGLVNLELKKFVHALGFFRKGLEAIDILPVIEDRLLYVRIGYNYLLANFYLGNNGELINFGYKLTYYLELNKIIYLTGRLNHLMSITFEKINDLDEAEKHMRKAADIFLVESKIFYYLKALRALSEIQFKQGNIYKGIETLQLAEDQLVLLDDPNDLSILIDSTKKKYLL